MYNGNVVIRTKNLYRKVHKFLFGSQDDTSSVNHESIGSRKEEFVYVPLVNGRRTLISPVHYLRPVILHSL